MVIYSFKFNRNCRWDISPNQKTFFKILNSNSQLVHWVLTMVKRTCSEKNLIMCNHEICSVQFSHSIMSDCLWPHALQHARPPCPSPTLGVHSNSCPLSRWCHPIISSTVVPFSSHLQSFPASVSFPMSQLFALGGHSIGVSASTSVLPVNIQDWFPLGWTGWISLWSKELSTVFSNPTVQNINSSALSFFCNHEIDALNLSSIHLY